MDKRWIDGLQRVPHLLRGPWSSSGVQGRPSSSSGCILISVLWKENSSMAKNSPEAFGLVQPLQLTDEAIEDQRREGLYAGSHNWLMANLRLAPHLPTSRPGVSLLPALPSVAGRDSHVLLLLFQGKEKFLGILNKYMEIHGTVYYESQRPPEVPAFVKNHGLLPQPEFQQLLRKAKVSPPLPLLTPAQPQTPRALSLHPAFITRDPFCVWTGPSLLCCPGPHVRGWPELGGRNGSMCQAGEAPR